MSDLLTVDDLRVAYARKGLALQGVSLTVPERSIVALLGANGAGKTTLIRAVTGLLDFHHGRVQGGSVRLAGASLERLQPHERVRRGIAQVPEGRMVFKQLSVEDNLQVGASVVPRQVVGEGLDQVYTLFPRLHERRKQLAGWMSGGEQQMLAIGRALITRPRLLLIDELSLGLAPLVVASIYETLTRIVASMEMSLLVVEQNASLALEFASLACVMDRGQVVLSGASADVAASELMQQSYLGAGAHG